MDTKLNEDGIIQSKSLINFIKEYNADIIFVSTLRRSIDTCLYAYGYNKIYSREDKYTWINTSDLKPLI